MRFTLLSTTLLLLTTSLTHAIPSPSPNANVNAVTSNEIDVLAPRQAQQPPQTGPQTSLQDPVCATYSRLANLTSIALNATIRAAFLRGSPKGTDPTRAILDRASKEFKARNLMFDAELNRVCGNLSSVALREVAVNFSNGVVAEWRVTDAVGAQLGSGTEVYCVVFILIMFVSFGWSL